MNANQILAVLTLFRALLNDIMVLRRHENVLHMTLQRMFSEIDPALEKKFRSVWDQVRDETKDMSVMSPEEETTNLAGELEMIIDRLNTLRTGKTLPTA